MRIALKMLVSLAWGLAGFGVQASDPWPDRPITLVAPGAAGGTADTFARMLAHGLAKELGQPVIVENRVGVGTLLGSQWVAKAKPDGYTLLVGMAALTISPHMYKHMAVDPTRDFTAVRLLARSPNVVVVPAASQVRDIDALVREARAHPKRFNYASGGVGISEHLSAELFAAMTGVELVHVPYKSSADSVMAVTKGEALVSFGNMAVALPQVKAGKLRAIAVTSKTRSANLPEVPTVEEGGVRGYEVSTWFGLLAPAGAPAHIVRKLDETTRRFLEQPEVRERFAAAGADVADEGPDAFAALLRADTAKWGELIRKANLRME
jgi:tripartite-type tricarboxylate transporter receptor subunit TctC